MATQNSKVEFPGRNCDKCQVPSTTETPLRRCNSCQAALYCSTQCQIEDWSVHKQLCRDKLLTVPIETRIPGVIKVGPVATVAELNAAKPGDAPPKDKDRVLLYDATPKQIHETSQALLAEYKRTVALKVKQGEEENKEHDQETAR